LSCCGGSQWIVVCSSSINQSINHLGKNMHQLPV
jgi:hypothetical protein